MAWTDAARAAAAAARRRHNTTTASGHKALLAEMKKIRKKFKTDALVNKTRSQVVASTAKKRKKRFASQLATARATAKAYGVK